jgi:S1-C subfamily serine protease
LELGLFKGYYIDMRRLTRMQVIVLGLGTVLIAILLAFGFGIFPIQRAGSADTSQKFLDSYLAQAQPARNIVTPITSDEQENIDIYRNLNPAVVNITTTVLVGYWFMEPMPVEGGTGSGSIIDRQGYVLTNFHVIEKADAVYINLADGQQFEGEIVGVDPENDLAVLKFNPGNTELQVIPFGSSENLQVGQKVLAIGNPFGFERTLTTGIVSGLGRPIRNQNNRIIQGMIQTDASINPGNSGGPLLDSAGMMIGINTMIYSPAGGSVGIGFAVPVNTAKRIIPDLIEFGEVKRGWIQMEFFQIDSRFARYARVPVSSGIYVNRIVQDGNAADAGLRGGLANQAYRIDLQTTLYLGGDIIQQVNGTVVNTVAEYYAALESTRPGDKIEIQFLRNNRERTAEIILGERPKSD